MRRLLLAALLLAGLPLPAAARPVLEKVVLLERHGVRSPTKIPDAATAREAWPVWPVAPGVLTEQGAADITRMGEALGRHYAALLPKQGCDGVFVWGDAVDQRTRESAKAVAGALSPDCAAHWNPGDSDPLFHPTEAGICPLDAGEAQKAVAPRFDMLTADRRGDIAKAQTALESVLGASLPDESRVKDGKLEGRLATASTLSEDLFLEYAQGMTAPGWGRADTAEKITAIMPLHNIASDLTRRTPYLARHGAALLGAQIAAALTGETAHFQGAAPVPEDAKLVVLLGHDTNLSNVSAALGLRWTLPGQPDDTAPDSALAFEVWRDGASKFVRVRLFYQTLDQLRNETQFDAAHPAPMRALSLAGCASAGCRLDDAVRRLKAIEPECLKP